MDINMPKPTNSVTIEVPPRLISGSRDYSWRVWDTAAGKCLLTVKEHSLGVYVMRVTSRDTQLLLTGSEDGSISVWHLTKLKK